MNTSNVQHFVLVFLFRITDIMFLHPPIIPAPESDLIFTSRLPFSDLRRFFP